ncbi:MAG: peptidoglycan DD-metalloendopeptidase family protein [Oscillospiraceae bacterium]|nr:peptidoglycan DD-metalloendopeptidase family protein [Oscillospiraceae bacterium]
MRFPKTVIRVIAIVLALLMAVAILLSVLGSGASAASASEEELALLRRLQTQLAQEKRDLQAHIYDLEEKEASPTEIKAVMDERVRLTGSERDNLSAQLEACGRLIAEREEDIADCGRKEKESFELYKARVRRMEENGTAAYCEMLFAAADWTDLLARVDYIQEIMTYDEGVRASLLRARAATEDAKAALEAAKEERETVRGLLEDKAEELQDEVETACRYVAELESSPDSYASLSAEREADEKELLRTIEAAAAETDRLRPVASTGTYIWPSSDSRLVTRGFGGWTHPEYGVYRVNYGVDVAADYGTSVMAVDGGVVVAAEYSSAYGTYVVVTHGNGVRTLYAHLSRLYVSPGDTVTQGSVLGLVGASGLISEPHLHFEVIRDGAKVDPLAWYTNYELAE